MIPNLALNKKNVIAFYKMAYMGKPAEAVNRYVGAEYIQHNPDVADKNQGFIDYFEKMTLDYPKKDISFVRAVAKDDLVALHTHQMWPGNEDYITMDFLGLKTMEK